MAAKRIDGKHIAQHLLDTLQVAIEQEGLQPILAIVQIGDNPASSAYIRQKLASAKAIGVTTAYYHTLEDVDTDSLVSLIHAIQAQDQEVVEAVADIYPTFPPTLPTNAPHGLLVQLPVPAHIDKDQLLAAIPPEIDVDGFHKDSPYASPVAIAVVRIVQSILSHPELSFDQLVKDKKIAVVGLGVTGGSPIVNLLQKYGLNPIVIRSKTENPLDLARQADILIAATGKPGLVTKDWIKPGAIVIDVGIDRVPNPNQPGKTMLVGDVDQSVWETASYVSPVPGGVGPVTVAGLLENVVNAAKSSKEH